MEHSVGDSTSPLVIDEIERFDFVNYAGASGDFNPIHVDETYARAAANPRVFGHGMLTARFVSTYLVE
jgi:acyl dehydratase